MGTDYVAGGLTDEEDGSCGLLLGFTSGILGRPGVDER